MLTWTTENPTKLGIYWFKGRVSGTGFEREDLGPIVVELVGEGPSFGVGLLTSEYSFTISELSGQWAGPLEPPVESSNLPS